MRGVFNDVQILNESTKSYANSKDGENNSKIVINTLANLKYQVNRLIKKGFNLKLTHHYFYDEHENIYEDENQYIKDTLFQINSFFDKLNNSTDRFIVPFKLNFDEKSEDKLARSNSADGSLLDQQKEKEFSIKRYIVHYY